MTKKPKWESIAIATTVLSSCVGSAREGAQAQRTTVSARASAGERRVAGPSSAGAEAVTTAPVEAPPRALDAVVTRASAATPADAEHPTLRVLRSAAPAHARATARATATPAGVTTLEDRYIVRSPHRSESALRSVYGRAPALAPDPGGYSGGASPRTAMGDSDPTDAAGHGRASGGAGYEPYVGSRGRAAPVFEVPAAAPPRAERAEAPTTTHAGATRAAPAGHGSVVMTVEARAVAAPSGPEAQGAQLAQGAPEPAEDAQTDGDDPTANRLTAASVGDTDRRANYLAYLARNPAEAAAARLDMTRRVRVRVVDAAGAPVHDALIQLASRTTQLAGRTHADGYWDFYPGVLAPGSLEAFELSAEAAGVVARATLHVPRAGDGPDVTLALPARVVRPPPALDLGFLIDATGSMGDELAYIDHEVVRIVERIRAHAPGVSVRVGATFYRDRGDAEQVMQIPFSADVQGFAEAMAHVRASGGGDYPEDMNAGLEAALHQMTWREGAAVRVLVLIADAPPQPYPDEAFTYHTAVADASTRGIRLLPVAASGANQQVEYLFRAMGALTSTPYVHLTDDSGIGGPHRDADTDRIAVERFNDLLTRMVLADLDSRGMHEPGALGTEQ